MNLADIADITLTDALLDADSSTRNAIDDLVINEVGTVVPHGAAVIMSAGDLARWLEKSGISPGPIAGLIGKKISILE